MNLKVLRAISRAFFLQDMVARAMAWLPPILQNNLGKYDSLKKAFYLTSHDGVEGDYLEFGVFTGASLAAAIRFSRRSFLPRQGPMRFFGFDSFAGFGELKEDEKGHGWLHDAHFETDAAMVRRRVERLVDDPSHIRLVEGFFSETLAGKLPQDYGIDKAAVVLIDCDTSSAAEPVFEFLALALQEGTILVIDDFFIYKGSSSRGVYGAFRKFEAGLKGWRLRPMWTYGCGGVVYIVTR